MERCAEDNVYYAPHYAVPLIETVSRKLGLKILTAWNGDALIALLPVAQNPISIPGLISVGEAWRTLYTFNCIPLIDRHDPMTAATALIEGLAGMRRGEWRIPLMNVDGQPFRAVAAALDGRHMPWLRINEFERACLQHDLTFESLMDGYFSSKRRRELARNRRRLEERGHVTVETYWSGGEQSEAVGIFLKLEASGWKGRQGTALSCNAETQQFAQRAFNAKSGKTSRVDVMRVGGTPVAAGIIVFAGKTGFTVKNAYDEAYSTFGVGLLLELEVLKSFLVERWADRLDAATNGSHVIDGFWPGRMRVADIVFSSATVAPRFRVNAYARSLATRDKVKAALKKLVR
jgi:hypothetical protein